MANKMFWVGMLVLVLVFGMTVIGCDNGTTGGGTTPTNNFTGTNWGSGSETLSFSSATAWSATLATDPAITISGTYTFSGNVATLTITSGGTGSGTATISGNTIIITITIDGTPLPPRTFARIVGTGGQITITGIHSDFNGRYALFMGDSVVDLMGATNLEIQNFTATMPRISGGSVTIPMWTFDANDNPVRFSGNVTSTYGLLFIFGQTTVQMDDNIMGMALAIRFWDKDIIFQGGNADDLRWDDGIDFDDL